MSEQDQRARMHRMGTPSWRVALRWLVGALAAAVLTTLTPVPSTQQPGGPATSESLDPAGDASTDPSPRAASVEPGVPITFPTETTAGLPAGWSPRRTHTGDLWIRTAGTVVEDLRITDGVIHVAAKNVTLRRVHAVGALVENDSGDTCGSGLVIEESTFVAGSAPTRDTDLSVIGNGGFTVRDVVIDGVPEGIRVGTKACGDVVVERSFIRLVPPEICGDWHGDGIQGYGGGSVTVRQTRIIMGEREDCYGTAPFFYPSGQGNTSLTVDGLLVEGGGYPFRAGTPGTVRNLQVVQDTWGFAPVDVLCSALTEWQAHVVTVGGEGRTTPGRAIECAGSGI